LPRYTSFVVGYLLGQSRISCFLVSSLGSILSCSSFCFHSNVVMTNATATGAIEWQRTFIARAISYFPLLHTNTHGRKLGTVKLSSKIGIASRRERGMTPNYYGVGNLFLVFSTARYHATTSVMGPFFFRLFWNRFLLSRYWFRGS